MVQQGPFVLGSDTAGLNECFSNQVTEEILKICQSEIIHKKRAFFTLAIHAIFLKFTEDGDIESRVNIVFSWYRAEINISHTTLSLKELFYNKYEKIAKRTEDFSENGSGWTLAEIDCIDLNYTSINSIQGGCYFDFKLRNKRWVLVTKNKDQYCLLYFIAVRLHSKSIPFDLRGSPDSYIDIIKNFNISGIHFPISIEEITILEKQNRNKHFKVNIFMEIENEIYQHHQYHLEEDDDPTKITPVNVLLSEVKNIKGETFFLFSLIENESKFFSAVYTTKKGQTCYSHSGTCS